MRNGEHTAAIYLNTEEKYLNLQFFDDDCVEDLCLLICRILQIKPVTRHLFALRDYYSKLWYPYGYRLKAGKKRKFDFRLRFKPSSLNRLKEMDEEAYNYYFQQVRTDIMNNKVPDIVYEKHKRELIGLGVSDMYRVMLEHQIPQETVESDYKRYIPKECIKRHAFFIKKPIHEALTRLSGHNSSFVKDQYLMQFESMAPNYPYEEYKALMDKGVPNPPAKIFLRINADELKYCEFDSDEWDVLCAIEDLCFISIRQDNTIEISRKNGIPLYLKLPSYVILLSFVTALDGYYRLSVKWTFNLCKNIVTPSLEKLQRMKCHGPVGQEFSFAKLKEKRNNKQGTYILRESEFEYNTYFIDLCCEGGKILSRKIQRIQTDEFTLSDSTQKYESMEQIISSFQDPNCSYYLEECLPPSEYDMSSLLLICASENAVNEVAVDEEIITALLEGGPRCVPRDQLQILKPLTRNDESASSITRMHRGMWRLAKGKKLEIAIKIIKSEENNYTKEFLELTGKWAQLRSGALVRLYGVTVFPIIGMLFELMELGPLDEYLRNNSVEFIKTVDLVEATTCLATAIWHLEDNNMVHGKIRCERLLVHKHTENSFIVKLSDPGLFIYTEADIHWIPPECYNNLVSAKTSFQADIWALGTTIWEIFSRGACPPTDLNNVSTSNFAKKFYKNGQRLPQPYKCPNEIYKLMKECWGENGVPRKQPQAVMRDINQILYQVYNSRKTHTYATVFPKLSNDTDDTTIYEDISDYNIKSYVSDLFLDDANWNEINNSEKQVNSHEDYSNSDDVSSQLSWLSYMQRSNGNSSKSSSICQVQSVLEMEGGFDVILQGCIGQGFYGKVFKGTLKRNDQIIQEVAVKKLKTEMETTIHDFEREIMIMKNLKHANIVEVLGVTVVPEGYLVMEFIQHGSLQSYLKIHRENLTHNKLLGFVSNIAAGMEYLACMNIIHRDLAARNILVADENLVKISDFGLAQVMGKNDYYILQTNRNLPIKWYAPESLRDGKFSLRSDIWSFGVTMYEIFSFGEDPNLPGLSKEENCAEMLAALEQGTRLPCPNTCPQEVYVKLMNPCWSLQSQERPNFSTLRLNIRFQ